MIDLTTIPTSELLSVLGKRNRAKQTTPPRAPVLRPCRFCDIEFGARAMRKHEPGCRKIRAATPPPKIAPEPTRKPSIPQEGLAAIRRFRGPFCLRDR